MENKKQVCSSSSSSSSLDHLFGPKDSSSSSRSGIFGIIFPPPSMVPGRKFNSSGIIGPWNNQGLPHHDRYGNQDHSIGSGGQSSGTTNKDESASLYNYETTAPCNLCSSIHYGGQENYYSLNTTTTTGSLSYLKKDEEDNDPNGSNSSGASRGNWWQGMTAAHFITSFFFPKLLSILPSPYWILAAA
ncbi:hypothetical protein V6N13_012700 [Hibiscus sabdariffa]|uniref:Uncharacterized protein n=1 Tax=Hibiscus sabdariffa TaxID=183260 RepID=A0ABR2SGG5_9ROSI